MSAEAQVANPLLTYADVATTVKKLVKHTLSWDIAYDIRIFFTLGGIVIEAYKDAMIELLEYIIAITGVFLGDYLVMVMNQIFLLYDNTRDQFYDWQTVLRYFLKIAYFKIILPLFSGK